MKNILILLFIILVAVAGYFVFSDKEETESISQDFTGEVVDVDLENIALDGPALITVRDESGDTEIVAVPSMGILLCEALENLTPVDLIEIGDQVSVKGETDEEGRIVPCTEASHYLRVMSIISDDVLGYEFTYPKGPVGYIVIEDNESQDPDFVSGLVLFDREEYEILMNSTDAREGPPSMHIRVYENPENLSAFMWPDRKPLESNIGLILGETEERVLSGANANYYVVDGLYPIETYIIANGDHVYVLMGSYLDKESNIYKDFQLLIDSFTFIRTGDQG